MRMIAMIAAAVLFCGCAIASAVLAPIGYANAADALAVDLSNALVMDGDTIRVQGVKASIRLMGYTSPATKAVCPNERALGLKAKARLYDMIETGPATLQLVPCACPPKTEGTGLCNYGRACGILSVNGVDVGKTLIAEQLAVPYVCGATSCPPIQTPWCK
ncbi:thermonuclease family protein [Roseiarcaceae bacterium H3SJ34-1]|uniref:thermonuclease family protein n=1 Tax=Terripilifer ovatus TaxID=3032367 RepID=UPI003AB97519|nr:thermonuclease family protein [Roseiarcaceae bacterium H3SJ34-1]